MALMNFLVPERVYSMVFPNTLIKEFHESINSYVTD